MWWWVLGCPLQRWPCLCCHRSRVLPSRSAPACPAHPSVEQSLHCHRHAYSGEQCEPLSCSTLLHRLPWTAAAHPLVSLPPLPFRPSPPPLLPPLRCLPRRRRRRPRPLRLPPPPPPPPLQRRSPAAKAPDTSQTLPSKEQTLFKQILVPTHAHRTPPQRMRDGGRWRKCSPHK